MIKANYHLLSLLLVLGFNNLSAEDKIFTCSNKLNTACNMATLSGATYYVCVINRPKVARIFHAVDSNTYRGWQTYETFCAVCHQKDAQGPKNEHDVPLSNAPECKMPGRPPNLMAMSEKNGIKTTVLGELNQFRALVENGVIVNEGECLPGDGVKNSKMWTLRMPKWNTVKLVKNNMSEIYGYLKLMQTGLLPKIRKERLLHLNASDLKALNCITEDEKYSDS